MPDIELYGSPLSPHVRAARLAFQEKGVAVTFREIGVDALAGDDYARINPLRKMPALVHGDLTLYETPALVVYADGVGSGPTLEPADSTARAKQWQYVGIAQHYLYPVGVMQLYFHTVLAGLFGLEPDGAAAQAAVKPTTLHLDILDAALVPGGGFLAGDSLSGADLYCGVMVDYVARTRDGRALVAARPKLAAWLEALRRRESFQATFPAMLKGTDQT
jgi:glutathione S-transferase